MDSDGWNLVSVAVLFADSDSRAVSAEVVSAGTSSGIGCVGIRRVHRASYSKHESFSGMLIHCFISNRISKDAS